MMVKASRKNSWVTGDAVPKGDDGAPDDCLSLTARPRSLAGPEKVDFLAADRYSQERLRNLRLAR